MALLSDKTIAALCTGDYRHIQSEVVSETEYGAVTRDLPHTEINNGGESMITL